MSTNVASRAIPRGRKRSQFELRTKFPGLPGYLPAERVQAHLRELNSYGLPARSIARDSGLCDFAVRQIIDGLYPTIRTRNADALLRVGFTPNERQQRVLAIGATRRARALQVIGWPQTEIVAASTLTAAQVAALVRARRTLTDWDVWKAMHDTYEQLSGTPGPSKSARTRAKRHGWGAPLDWEDLDIDDPRVTPETAEATWAEQRAQTKAERIAEVARLTDAGLSSREIGERLGVTQRQVVRDRREAQTSPTYSGKDFASRDNEIAC
ncbi:helix-turn-helix domain-containing protein [Nocardia cyriacigeorgica]|uniref:hypothetical protein n=1 Tax=Nocardia cyriacigeorgica TaxID=135487 RepID=UPI00189515D6|nr:hypothetical protein [Nocardia cyriacigeorgica]MBF6416916.1 hypothetical protein [Nocardia cyriacigeorgica]